MIERDVNRATDLNRIRLTPALRTSGGETDRQCEVAATAVPGLPLYGVSDCRHHGRLSPDGAREAERSLAMIDVPKFRVRPTDSEGRSVLVPGAFHGKLERLTNYAAQTLPASYSKQAA